MRYIECITGNKTNNDKEFTPCIGPNDGSDSARS